MSIARHFFHFAAIVAVSACNGGWTSQKKENVANACLNTQEVLYPDDARAICDCYLQRLIVDFPKADMSEAQASSVLLDCSAEAKLKMQKENERKLQEMLNSMEFKRDTLRKN